MFRKVLLVKTFFLLLIIFSGCSKGEPIKEIDFSKTEKIKNKMAQETKETLRMAIGGMITPREGFAYYKELLDYLGEKLGQRVAFVDREDYAEINNLLRNSELDAAFVCGGPYVEGHKEFGMELLAAPKAYGGTVYYSYIIVHKDSPIKDFTALKGKTFAFTDPLSNTGKLVPTYMLAKMGETPETFFKHFEFSHAHDKSIKAVATKIVEGAAVDSLIWEYANRTDPEFTSQTKIIQKSPPYGIPPVVVRAGLAPELKEKLRQIFLNAHRDEKGKKILQGMMIDEFVSIEDSAYNTIREMQDFIAKQDELKPKTK